jgi:hypothetical protein
MSRALAAAIAVSVLAAVPGVAHAKTYKGKTSQGHVATLTTGADGVVTRVRLVWRAPCGQHRRFGTATVFTPPFDGATADMVRDAGTYRTKINGYVGRITGTLVGQRDPATDRWSGTFAVKVRVSRHGKVVDHCSASRLTWKVK